MAPWRRPDSGVIDYSPIHISKMVLPTVNLGPPPLTVDTTIFEMWMGRLSTHQGLSTHISHINSEGRTVISNSCT